MSKIGALCHVLLIGYRFTCLLYRFDGRGRLILDMCGFTRCSVSAGTILTDSERLKTAANAGLVVS